MAASPITLQDIYRARASIAGHVQRTPLVPSVALSARLGVPVHLKLETLQTTGAFKLRGAVNRLGPSAMISPFTPFWEGYSLPFVIHPEYILYISVFQTLLILS